MLGAFGRTVLQFALTVCQRNPTAFGGGIQVAVSCFLLRQPFPSSISSQILAELLWQSEHIGGIYAELAVARATGEEKQQARLLNSWVKCQGKQGKGWKQLERTRGPAPSPRSCSAAPSSAALQLHAAPARLFLSLGPQFFTH